MNSKQNTQLTLIFLDNCLRLDDSQMINFYCKLYKQQRPNEVFVVLLIGNQENKHKREFDLQQAQMLNQHYLLQISYIHDIYTFKRGLLKLINHIDTLSVLIQDTYYNRRNLNYIFKSIPQKNIKYTAFSEISDQTSYISDVHCSLKVNVVLFQDFLCSDYQAYSFSNVYGYFNKRVKLREMHPKSNISSILNNNKQNTFNKQLSIVPILQVKLSQNTIYPTQNEIWGKFKNHLYNYSESRDKLGSLFDFSESTSSFQSPFLSAGVISTTQLLQAIDINSQGCKITSLIKKVNEKQINPETNKQYSMKVFKESIKKYRDEVLWAEFCHLYWIYNKSELVTNGVLNIGGLYNRKRKWIKNTKLLHQFEYGQLDPQFDLINASMNQLRSQGFMSNRLRMITASFCMQQHLDWRDCMNIFEKYLIDINWSSNLYGFLFSNNLTAGQPHTFNIERQTKKIDKDSSYRNKWLKRT